jgi:hypothetical protein
MHNLATHIDGCSEGVQSDFHNVDGAHHARAKAARLQQQHPFLAGGCFDVGTVGDGIKGRSRHIPKYTNRCIEKTGNPPQVAFQSPSRQPSNRNTRLCRHKPGDPIKRCLQRPQVSATEDYPRAPNFNESKSYRLPEAFALTGFLFDRRQSQA